MVFRWADLWVTACFSSERSVGAYFCSLDVSDQDTLKFAANYKFDEHKEHNDGEPVQTTKDAMYSFALENTYKFTDYNKLILGVNYNIRDSKKTEKYGSILAKKPHFYSFTCA